MSSIPTTHLATRSLSGHSTFIAESIGTLCHRPNTSSLSENFLANLSGDCLNSGWRTPSGSLGPDLTSGSNSGVKRSTTCRHARHFSLTASPTHRRMRVCGPTSDEGTPPATSSTSDLSPCHLTSPLWCRKMPFVPIFSPATVFKAFLKKGKTIISIENPEFS